MRPYERRDGRPLFRPMLGHLPPRGKDLDGERRAVGDRPYERDGEAVPYGRECVRLGKRNKLSFPQYKD